jgi:hypothetical protein
MKKKTLFFLLFILVVASDLFAQMSDTPILWLKADSGITLSSGNIVSWLDQSGKNNSVRQDSVWAQPILLTNLINGHSAVKFQGWNHFLTGPSVFPCKRDYTITAVIRIDDSTAIQNILSGTAHALFFSGDLFPRVVHEDFALTAISRLKLGSGFGIVTVRYSEYNEQVKFYVNGQSGDSLYIRTNHTDSTLLIGAFNNAYGLNGAIAEIILYDRQISEEERGLLEGSLRSKYGISLGAPQPKPDSTFTSIPANLQLYPRDKNDSAVVTIAGSIFESAFTSHYDSIYVEGFKNDTLYCHTMSYLNFADGKAPFAFECNIHAELSEYKFTVHLKNILSDTTITTRTNIACGDVFFIGGESNSMMGFWSTPYQNEYCRTFGTNLLQNIRDTLWAFSDAQRWGDGPSVSGWGLMLQKLIKEKIHIPTCIIDGGLAGTIIPWHLRVDSMPNSLQTIYGRWHYRAQKAGVDKAAKAIFWLHGEIDYYNPLNPYYTDDFKILYKQWHEDYPGLEKIYLVQIRPAYCVDQPDVRLRNWQREFQDSLSGIVSISSTMFPDQDGCHYFPEGFQGIADQLLPILARDFYASTDTIGILSPNIIKAFYTTSQNNEIALLFSPHNSGISTTNDTTVGNISATMKDYLYPDDELGKVESIRFSGDTLFLKLYSSSTATTISYIPDRYYNGSDSVFYEGPWLKSSRGIGALIFWHFPIDDWKSDTNIPYIDNNVTLDVMPNPVANITVVKFNLPQESDITLSIYDVLGEKITTLFSGKETIGVHAIPFDTRSLSAGEYFCRLQDADKTVTQKIIVTK